MGGTRVSLSELGWDLRRLVRAQELRRTRPRLSVGGDLVSADMSLGDTDTLVHRRDQQTETRNVVIGPENEGGNAKLAILSHSSTFLCLRSWPLTSTRNVTPGMKTGIWILMIMTRYGRWRNIHLGS